MEFLQGFRVGKRLAVAFTVLLLFIGVIVAIALYGLRDTRQNLDTIVSVNGEKTRLLNEMLENNFGTFVARREFLLARNPEERDAAMTKLAGYRDGYMDAAKKLDAMPSDADGMKYRQAIAAAFDEAGKVAGHFTELVDAGDTDAAIAYLNDTMVPVTNRWQAAIKQNIQHQQMLNQRGNVAAELMVRRSTLLLALLGGIAAVVGIAFAVVVTRSLTGPLQRAIHAARDIAAGKLDGTRLDGGRDEVGDLLRSMQTMRDVLQRFAGESKRMAHLHASGENIRYRMPEDFPGTYNELVAGTNNMVYEHLDAIVGAIEVLNEYAIGDLSRDVPRLPGQRAIMHESMDAAKASLMAMRDSILHLSGAAANGDFSVREDADRFQHSFREMVTALNRLMAEAGGGLQDIGRVISAIATGDLRQRVEKSYEGAFGLLAEDANRTAEQLTGIVGGILHASDTITTAAGEIAAGNSDLSRRTEQQAANLEETAASMEELTSTVKQNAESARQANQLAQGAASVARDGGEVVGQVVTTMHGIEASSKKIAEIISVIDGIAFQTVTSVQHVTDIMAEISAASQEQSAGIEQVNLTITQMDETTQQNAALVEEATAAARSMEEQADGLMEAVSVFRTGAEVARALPAATARSAAPQAPVAVAPVQKRAVVKPVPAAKPAARPRPAAVARAVPELALASDNEWQEF